MNWIAAAPLLVLSSLSLASAQSDLRANIPTLAPRLSGERVVEFPSSGVQLRSWLPLGDLDANSATGSDCWGYTSPSGREYALMGTNTSTVVVEITDPGQAQVIQVLPWIDSLWKDIKTYQEYAYVINESDEGIQILNLTNIDAGVVTIVGTTNTGACTGASHNVVINEDSGYLYRVGGNDQACGPDLRQGLVIYSLANPASPSFVALVDDFYVHDAQVVTWDVPGPHFGKELAFLASQVTSGGGLPTMRIMDVTNKANITTLGMAAHPDLFCHQLWLSDDKTVVYMNDELDEANFGWTTRTRMVDVSDPVSPSYLGFFSTGLDTIDHNLYVKGDRIYQSNYTSGLRVFDNTSVLAPVEIAFFDTWTPNDSASFNGLWSNYPFFDSGTVIGSDIDNGLFVWTIGDPTLEFEFPLGNPEFVLGAAQDLPVTVNPLNPGDLDPTSVKLNYDLGSGFVSAPATSLGGNSFALAFPALDCQEALLYYVSAQTTAGDTWTFPAGAPCNLLQRLGAIGQSLEDEDDIEANSGWSEGSAQDTATTGQWVRGNPLGTAIQPEDDHTPSGTDCWFTGQGSSGGSTGEADIDGGLTTLVSRTFDASGLNLPVISYWRWYHNGGNGTVDDVFTVDVSGNNGGSWVNVETLGPLGSGTSGGWIQHSFAISDYVTPGSSVRLRFRASDEGGGSLVEAAVDDVQITDLSCDLSVASVSPDTGSVNRDQRVTVTGSGFQAGETTVFFGGKQGGSVVVLNANTLEVDVPRAGRTPVGKQAIVNRTVKVTVRVGLSGAELPNGYTYSIPSR